MCDEASSSVGRIRVEFDPKFFSVGDVGGDGGAAEVAQDWPLGIVPVNLDVVAVAIVAVLKIELEEPERVCKEWTTGHFDLPPEGSALKENELDCFEHIFCF